MRFSKILALLIIELSILSGCNVKDNFMDSCYEGYLLRVLMDENANDNFDLSPFTPNDISLMIEPHEVLIYVFSKETVLLGIHRTIVGETIKLPYPKHEQLLVKAVATAKGEPIEELFTQFKVGEKYNDNDLLFALAPISKSSSIAMSPTDFMYASDNFPINPYNDRNIIYYLYLNPKIGAIKVVTVGLKEWADNNFGITGNSTDEFTFIIGSTLDKYNLGGILYGAPMNYQPITLYSTSNNEISTPMFNLMPAPKGSAMKVYIYRNETMIYPTTDNQKAISYIVPPRTPYIIKLDFSSSGGGDDGDAGIVPAKYQDIYIVATF